MFRGITDITMDGKGRLALPARYRTELKQDETAQKPDVVVTIDTESPCLLLYPYEEWLLIEEKIGALPTFNKTSRRIQRLLIGHATELELDGQGRILLPSLLREYAHLEKDVMLVGQGKKFEIWSEANWRTNRESWLTEELEEDKENLPIEMQNLSL